MESFDFYEDLLVPDWFWYLVHGYRCIGVSCHWMWLSGWSSAFELCSRSKSYALLWLKSMLWFEVWHWCCCFGLSFGQLIPMHVFYEVLDVKVVLWFEVCIAGVALARALDVSLTLWYVFPRIRDLSYHVFYEVLNVKMVIWLEFWHCWCGSRSSFGRVIVIIARIFSYMDFHRPRIL